MTPRLRLCILLIVGLGVAPAQAGPTIRIYTDLAGTCNNGTTVNGVLQGSVWANDVDGLTGAEFAVYCSQDCTKDLLLQFTPEPSAALQLGDPLLAPIPYWDNSRGTWTTGGTNIAFSTCQTGSRVRLFTFLLVEMTPTHDITLRITRHDTPSNGGFYCPLITLCDGPIYTKLCVTSNDSVSYPFSAIINALSFSMPECPSASGTPLNVHPVSWSAVKNLYR